MVASANPMKKSLRKYFILWLVAGLFWIPATYAIAGFLHFVLNELAALNVRFFALFVVAGAIVAGFFVASYNRNDRRKA